MEKLALWAPETLKKLYANDIARLAESDLNPTQLEALSKRVDALCRLGNRLEMRDVWKKLLIKDATILGNQKDKEQALVVGIYQLLLNTRKQYTAKEKNEQLAFISKKIKELKTLIERADEASFEDKSILETILHKQNIQYRNQLGENISLQSPNYLKFINANANAELSVLPLDENIVWEQRTQAQRLGWWTREALQLKLTDILSYYSERMLDYSKVYKESYQLERPRITQGLQRLMTEIYGSRLDEHVSAILSAILDKPISRDTVRSSRKR